MVNIEVSKPDPDEMAFAGNHLLTTFSSEARALLEAHGELIALKPGDIVLTRGEQVRFSVFPVGETMISMAVELSRRAHRRGRLDRPRRRGRRDRQLRLRTGLLARGVSRRRARVPNPDGRARGCEGQLGLHRQPVLPLLRLSPCAGHAVGRLPRLPFDPRARRALAAACAGPRRRPHRADPGSLCRTARGPAHDGQCGDPGVVQRRTGDDRARNDPGDRPRAASSAAAANATPGSTIISTK